MEESYFSKQMSELEAKFEARLSALESEKIALSAENKELTERLANEPAPHTLHNPEANMKDSKLVFKLGAKREETLKDRVFNQLFN
jgi:regulator of replication initiation timing